MKTISSVIAAILLLPVFSLAQWVEYQPDSPLDSQPLLQDSSHNQLNFYDQSGNIAGLFFDERAFSLWSGGNFVLTSGEFRNAITPQDLNGQQFNFRLVKPLTAGDIFKGYFGFQRVEDRNLRWIHQNRHLETNPFLLGDSSTGNFVLNGIFWKGEWAHALGKSFYSGLGMYYNVDRRLKKNFPKPENQHRDIHFQAGLQKNWNRTQVGLAFRYFDEQEKVEISRYNLDQNLTPELYKFRFSDLPVILLGKTSEERQLDYRGLTVNFHCSRKISAGSMMIGTFSYAQSQGETVDGGSQPQDQGTFQRNDWQGKAIFHTTWSAVWSGRASYTLNYRRFTAKPPEFDLTAIKHPLLDNQLLLSVKKSGINSALFVDLLYHNISDRLQDLITVNQYQYRYHLLGIKMGWEKCLTARWEYQLWGKVCYYSVYQQSRTDNRYSDFFNDLFVKSYDYLANRSFDWAGGMQVIYHYGPLFDTELTMIFDRAVPGSDFPLSAYRQNFFLKMIVKFFII